MWQLLLAATAAAVAGSTTFVARHFFNLHENCEKNQRIASPLDAPEVTNNCTGSGYESNFEQGIFRFSSSGCSGKKSLSSRKKLRVTCRRLGFRNEQRSGSGSGSSKRFSVCLKKRRTAKSKSEAAKRRSSASKDGSLFGWGLGVGIMCMMSAGKGEISKLSTTMDETAKVVQELRNEIYKRKSASQGSFGSRNISVANNQHVLNGSSVEERNASGVKMHELIVTDDADCPSSVLTDEPEPVLEMDQLEAELESELLKLPLSTSDDGGPDTIRADLGEAQVSSEGFHEMKGNSAVSYQCQGVLPSELDQKLCHLLIEQQDSQIGELESELRSAQSKLNEKEAELQALKDCVRRLTSFSLSTASDDEDEVRVEQGRTSELDTDSNSMIEFDLRKSVVGMKRPIDSA